MHCNPSVAWSSVFAAGLTSGSEDQSPTGRPTPGDHLARCANTRVAPKTPRVAPAAFHRERRTIFLGSRGGLGPSVFISEALILAAPTGRSASPRNSTPQTSQAQTSPPSRAG